MTTSSVDDRILQALLEIAGEKYGAEIKAHINERSEKKG